MAVIRKKKHAFFNKMFIDYYICQYEICLQKSPYLER